MATTQLCNIQDKQGNTPLHLAAGLGHLEVVTTLTTGSQFTDPDLKNADGDTALHCAARNGHDQVVNAILSMFYYQRGGASYYYSGAQQVTQAANPNILNNAGLTPRDLAAMAGKMEKMSEALKMQQQSAAYTYKTVTNPRHSLPYAVSTGQLQEVQAILDAAGPTGLDALRGLDPQGWSPLDHAVEAGHETIVSLLRVKGFTHSLHYAVLAGSWQDMLDALKACDDANKCNAAAGDTALHLAAARGHAEKMKTLLQHRDANVDVVNSSSCTPLHQATRAGHVACVEVLLQHKASTSVQVGDESVPKEIDTLQRLLPVMRASRVAASSASTRPCSSEQYS